MKKILIGVIIALTALLTYKSCDEQKEDKKADLESQGLLQTQLKNISKLQVTEGYFSEVFTYKDSRDIFGPFLQANKKALVVVNARVSLQYDLQQMNYRLDPSSKSIYVDVIPEVEISINPDIQYYDIQSDYLNPFGAEDYNLIKEKVNTLLLNKVKTSSMTNNAQNRLLTELSQLFFLTKNLGWKLVYNGITVNKAEELMNTPKG